MCLCLEAWLISRSLVTSLATISQHCQEMGGWGVFQKEPEKCSSLNNSSGNVAAVLGCCYDG